MQRYIVTYTQEVTQPVDGETPEAVGTYAKNFAADRKGMRLLSVVPVATPALPAPAA
jgi:hypothetical protein